MKKLLTLGLMLFTLNIFSQMEKLEGTWKSEGTEYVTSIFYKKGKFTFVNVGPEKTKEVVVNKGKNFVTTRLDNLANGYKVLIKYTLLTNDTFEAEFIGDWQGVLIYKKYNE
tara:strand:+ start:623 stop:958 length:336 start_codon:yes stop_codon:yes gene_type:complete